MRLLGLDRCLVVEAPTPPQGDNHKRLCDAPQLARRDAFGRRRPGLDRGDAPLKIDNVLTEGRNEVDERAKGLVVTLLRHVAFRECTYRVESSTSTARPGAGYPAIGA